MSSHESHEAGTHVLEVDVAVVGAGLSGLAAARTLDRRGLSVAVLEARNRVGGRTLNEQIGDGKIVELGGQWVGPGQINIARLADDLGVATFPTYYEGENLFEFKGRTKRYRGGVPKISPLALVDFEQARRRLDRMANEVSLERPWDTPKAPQWDSQTAWSWMRRNVHTRAGRTLWQLATESVWAVDPADLSLLHMLFYIRSAGSLFALTDTKGGAQQDRLVGGSQELSLRMAAGLRGPVITSAPVRRIEHHSDRVIVYADRHLVRAHRVIVAIAPALAGRIEHDPRLPGQRDQLQQRMPQGTVIKCMAIYDRPFWRNDGLTGHATSDRGPVSATFDNSPPDGSPGVLLGFLEGRQARRLGGLAADKRRAAVMESFSRLFGPRAARPKRYLESAWTEDPWTRGCYNAYMTPGGWTSYGPALRGSIGRLHWAGSETAVDWYGSMDGAISAGQRAANEVLTWLEGTPTPTDPQPTVVTAP